MNDARPDNFSNPVPPEPSEVTWLHLLGTGRNGSTKQGATSYLYMSTLLHAQQEMNSARGRRNTEIITPLLAAFAILDQVGECYAFRETLPGEPPPPNPAIKRALHHFPPTSGPLDPDQMQALYMLRNGLMHDAAFSAVERGGRKRPMIFRHDVLAEAVVKPPDEIWDGSPGDVRAATITWFNPDLVLSLANAAIGRLSKALQHQDAALVVRLDPEVVAARYLLWHRFPMLPDPAAAPIDREAERKKLHDQVTDAEVKSYLARYHG